MTCRLKSDHGNLAVRPCRLGEVLGVIQQTKFFDKGSVSGSSKLAGCSESLGKKLIGKPSTGKLYAGFDEGKLEIGHG